jgi:hypothetical protein
LSSIIILPGLIEKLPPQHCNNVVAGKQREFFLISSGRNSAKKFNIRTQKEIEHKPMNRQG